MPNSKCWRAFFALLFTSAIVLTACSKHAPPASEAKRFHLKGKIISIDVANNSLTVDHESIPGFMDAMTMPYSVRSARALAGLGPGDEITADVVVPEDGSAYLENIVVTKKGSGIAPLRPVLSTILSPARKFPTSPLSTRRASASASAPFAEAL
jgi:protein SCO1/2